MPRSWIPAIAVAVVALVALPAGSLAGNSYAHSAGTHSGTDGVPPGTSGRLDRPLGKPSPRPATSDGARVGAARARPADEPHASAVPSVGSGPVLFPPNPVLPQVVPGGTGVSSVYTSAPAPMGLSDLGIGPSGPYEYGTSSFEGTLTLASFSAFTATNNTVEGYPAPNWVLLQLDAVAVNVTVLPGNLSNGTFWVQNGLHFNGTSLALEDNIWNFSNKLLNIPPTSLVGRNGTILSDGVYVGYGPNLSRFTVAYPLTIELFDNITTTGSHTVVSVGYSFSDPDATSHGTYDVVTFNGTSKASAPSQFRVDGATTTPAGLLYDAELDLGGNGNGENADVIALNGTATLKDHNATGYHPIPSAFDFGADSSETAVGVAVAYTGTTERLTAGPSFLNGLWNTTGASAGAIAPHADPGWIEVRLSVGPVYAMVFATNASTLGAASSLADADYQYAPTNASGGLTTDLPIPGTGDPYVFRAWANGATSAQMNLTSDNATATAPATLTLPNDPSTIDAPVYLMDTAQAKAFAEANIDGTGYSAATGRLWLNATADELAAPFLRVNEIGYPTFALFAADRVNLSVDLYAFVQAPGPTEYASDTGKGSDQTNYSQGYFFYYGDGRFAVQNTSIEGNATLVHGPPVTNPSSTIEFYRTTDASARNVTVADDAVGITIVASVSAAVSNLQVGTGGLGILAKQAGTLTVVRASAGGHDPYEVSSTIADLVASSAVSLTNLSVAGSAVNPTMGVVSQGGSGLDISQLTVTSGAQGLAVNATGSGSVTDLNVTGGTGVSGYWTNASTLQFTHVNVNGSGLNLSDDNGVTVDDGSASGVSSAVVGTFVNSTAGTFRQIAATGGADGLILVQGTDVNVSEVSASHGSLGAYLSNVAGASGTDFTSAVLSIGLFLNDTPGATFTAFTASNQSLGVYAANSTGLTIERVQATNSTDNLTATYFSNTSSAPWYPIAGVSLLTDKQATVENVSAIDYAFAVVANNSSHVNISLVTSLYGEASVVLNLTNSSNVKLDFAFGDQVGVWEQNCTGTTVATSTFELSAGVGLEVLDSNHTSVVDNNFIANNGSSIDGGYNSSNLQAWSNGTNGSPVFRDNYWSDRHGATYPINTTGPDLATDSSPLGSLYSGEAYLEFTETGLPAGTSWEVVTLGETYRSSVSLLVIPGWEIPGPVAGTLVPFVVPSVLSGPGGYGNTSYPSHPPSGSVTWKGATLEQSIVFGSPSSSSLLPLPLWELATIVAVVAVGVVVALVLLRGRPGPGARRPPDPRDEDPFA